MKRFGNRKFHAANEKAEEGWEAYLGFQVWECPMFQKYWLWSNQMAPSK